MTGPRNILARYVSAGALVFAINLLVALLVFSVPLTRASWLHTNIANVLATEITFLISFFIHRYFTWQTSTLGLWPGLKRFHLVAAGGLTIRFAVFGLLDWMGLHWLAATVLSVGSQTIFNFLGFDQYVFRLAASRPPENETAYAADGTGKVTLETLEEARRYNAYVFSHLRPALGAENLELGAGSGTITALALATHRVRVCDAATYNLSQLRERFRDHPNLLEVRANFFDFTAPIFDCIYSSNVLEHIEDDEAVLTHAYRILKPGGRFVAFVPAGAWLYSDFDRSIGHFRRYGRRDRRRFDALIKRQNLNFSWTRFQFVNLPGAFAWFLRMRLLRSPGISREDALMADRLIGLFGLFDILRPPVGQSLVFELCKHS